MFLLHRVDREKQLMWSRNVNINLIKRIFLYIIQNWNKLSKVTLALKPASLQDVRSIFDFSEPVRDTEIIQVLLVKIKTDDLKNKKTCIGTFVRWRQWIDSVLYMTGQSSFYEWTMFLRAQILRVTIKGEFCWCFFNVIVFFNIFLTMRSH